MKARIVPVVTTLEATEPSKAGSGAALGPPSDPFDAVAEVILRIRPLSLYAAGIAIAATLAGALLQSLVVITAGSGIPFAGFFPVVAIASIVAGAPAGVAVSFASLLIVWWAVREPRFNFHALSEQELAEMAWLLVCALFLVGFGLLCRVLLKRAYERQKAMNVLVRELEHRRANTFSVLRAITTRTLRHQPEAAERLLRRFEAIRRTNDLLTEQPKGALLMTILKNELEGITSEQVVLHGSDVMLSADQVRQLILILHELLTNAVKYGALSDPAGQLRIEWSRTTNGLSISWQEEGSRIVIPPGLKGFGTPLIEHCVAALRGSWEPTFESVGFRCRLEFPLTKP